MRSFLFLLFFLPITLLAQENKSFIMNAKIKQGSILIGGTLNATADKMTDELSLPGQTVEGTKIQAMLQAKNGYFLLHDFAVGLNITMNHESLKITSNAEQNKPFRKTMLLAGPFTRYYLDNGVFGELSLEMGLLNFSTGEKNNLYAGALGVGYAYFFNEKFSLEPLLSVRYFKQIENGKSYITYGPMLGFGVQAYLLRKRANVIKQAL
ncbi:hypothetical protein [Pontibacter liquoris]|uniref:hypothetical protein n=1 Tax=Pontibacter liquoris TaxID=2905677 RepID=UPI001FA6E70E|nr:hypothetical protein [Pontibacter liquoris]